MRRIPILIRLIAAIFLPIAARADEIDDLVAKLSDESFEIRESATRDLMRPGIDRERLKKLAAATPDPEIRMRLAGILGVTGNLWIKLDKAAIAKLNPTGGENGQHLYLARTEKDGATIIGKYMTEWEGANFPIGETEVMINEFTLWTGKGAWKPWHPGLRNIIAMGKTMDGKTVYACRAKFGPGTHQGTFIEGEEKARIPWGGIVHRLENFEVLTAGVE
jgi:Protein of unknown function (DUF3421)